MQTCLSEGIVLGTGILRQFYQFFWDVQPEKLDVQKDAAFILDRLLEMGDDAALRWVRANYPEDIIKEIVKNSRRLSRKTARFWQAYFRLEEGEVRCLSRYYPQTESPLWPY